MKLTINIDAAHDGKTIKQLFAEKSYSLELIKKFKYDGAIEVNGERKTVRWVLREGDLLVLEANESAVHPVPAETPAVIVYADNYLYLADKPYGINTHPQPRAQRRHAGKQACGHFRRRFCNARNHAA